MTFKFVEYLNNNNLLTPSKTDDGSKERFFKIPRLILPYFLLYTFVAYQNNFSSWDRDGGGPVVSAIA